MNGEPLTLDGSPVPEPRPSYGASERHEAPRLFDPGRAPMPGQSELFDPDNEGTNDA